MRRFLVTALVLTAAVAVLPTSVAHAAYKYTVLSVSLASHTGPLTVVIEHTGGYDCVGGTIAVESASSDDTPVTPLAVTEDPENPNRATVVFPSDTPPGEFVIVSTCGVGEGTVYAMGELEFAALAVTKVVSGPVPADASFTVHVACAPYTNGGSVDANAVVTPLFEVDLVYGPPGGVKYVYSDGPVVCTLTEPVTGGAASVTITPEQVVMSSPSAFAATVTNIFPAAAVVVQPNFTG